MKCPECGYNQKVKYGLTCGGCSYRFVFDPNEASTKGLSDGKFLACIRASSQNDTAYFTRNQLYAECCRRLSGGLIERAVGGLLSWLGVSAAGPTITPAQFECWLNLWTNRGRTIEKLIERPALHAPPPDWSEPDVYDYGVERLLIVERDILVDLLVRNGVHAEQRMLVISETGYPDYLLPVADRLLREWPELPVFLLHDATAQGAAMLERLLSSGPLPLDGHPRTDLGMFPADFQKLKRTRRFDPEDTTRALPADALRLPFMTMGLESAMAGQVPLGTVIDQQQRSTAYVDLSFGSDVNFG